MMTNDVTTRHPLERMTLDAALPSSLPEVEFPTGPNPGSMDAESRKLFNAMGRLAARYVCYAFGLKIEAYPDGGLRLSRPTLVSTLRHVLNLLAHNAEKAFARVRALLEAELEAIENLGPEDDEEFVLRTIVARILRAKVSRFFRPFEPTPRGVEPPLRAFSPLSPRAP